MTIWRKFLHNLAYYRRPPWDTGRVPPEVEEFLHSHSPGRALDVGCGSGTSSIALAQAGWIVTGVDLALRAVRLARQKAMMAGVNVNFQVADFLRFRPDSSAYDLVLDVGCFHGLMLSRRVDYLHKVERLLFPDGFWLLYAFLKTEKERGKWLRRLTWSWPCCIVGWRGVRMGWMRNRNDPVPGCGSRRQFRQSDAYALRKRRKT